MPSSQVATITTQGTTMKRHYAYCIFKIVMSLLLWQGVAHAATTIVVDKDVRVAMLKLDYSAYIGRLDTVPMANAAYWGVVKSKDIVSKDISTREQQLLSTLVDKAGSTRISAGAVPAFVLDYVNKYQRLPHDGAELLAYISPQWTSKEGFAEFQQLPVDTQLRIVSCALNPATGKLYPTFSKLFWSDCGMRFRKQTGKYANLQVPIIQGESSADNKHDTKICQSQAWEFVIFGEKHGEVLLRSIIYQVKTDAPQKLSSKCGCKGQK
jgi:hypothetical protein